MPPHNIFYCMVARHLESEQNGFSWFFTNFCFVCIAVNPKSYGKFRESVIHNRNDTLESRLKCWHSTSTATNATEIDFNYINSMHLGLILKLSSITFHCGIIHCRKSHIQMYHCNCLVRRKSLKLFGKNRKHRQLFGKRKGGGVVGNHRNWLLRRRRKNALNERGVLRCGENIKIQHLNSTFLYKAKASSSMFVSISMLEVRIDRLSCTVYHREYNSNGRIIYT